MPFDSLKSSKILCARMPCVCRPSQYSIVMAAVGWLVSLFISVVPTIQ